ncbi:MAG: DNA primase [Pseudomonadota bacterium]
MSGRIPRDFIDDVIARIDIIDLIDERVPLKKTGSNYVARCPFHNEKTPSFSVSRTKQVYHCFGCGAGGNAISFLMDYDHMTFVEAVEDLASRLGMDVPRDNQASLAPGREGLNLTAIYELQARAAAFYTEQLRRHSKARAAVDYLKARGVSGEIAQTYLLGYAPPEWGALAKRFDPKMLREAGLTVSREGGGGDYDRFRNRIMFPIRDRRGRITGFGGRVLDDSTPKYLNSPETPAFQKGKEVYGLYELLDSTPKPIRILLVEGYMDVIALAQHGLTCAVATLGTATSRDHLELLFRYTQELVFCFDGDAAGRKAAWRALEAALPALRDGRQVRIMLIPQGHDPDTLVREEGAELFARRAASAKPLSDYFFDHLSAESGLTEIEGRASLVSAAKPLLGKIPEGTFRELMLERLMKLAKVESLELPAKQTTLTPRKMPHAESRGNRIQKTPTRVAIALLLQHPHLAQTVVQPADGWPYLESAGVVLLKCILALLSETPDLKLGGILERFRGGPEENQIKTLAQWDTLIPEQGVETEFADALRRLTEQAEREQLEKLLVKAKKETLSDPEREDLRRRLTASHSREDS